MLVLVSGASSGIGRAIVEACLREGFSVVAGVRNLSALSDLEGTHSKLKVIKLDVANQSDVEMARQVVQSEIGTEKFALINNAGIAFGGPLEVIPLDEWRKVFDVNVFGLVALTKALLPLLRKSRGTVINVGSVSGRVAAPYLAPYTSSKFAVRAISDSLRRELKPFGVKVSLLEPGPVQTPIWEKSVTASDSLRAVMTPEQVSVYEPALAALVKGVETTAKDAVPVSHVTDKVLEALKSENPKAYYPIGKNMKILRLTIAALPVTILDRLLVKGFRLEKGSSNEN